MDLKLELIVLSVADVERAKSFYVDTLGFRLDVDHRAGDAFRVVQMTPPGSACSITVGTGISSKPPGSAEGLHLVVSDVQAARAELVARGAQIGEPFHFGPEGRVAGPHPEGLDYATFASFQDPDGNGWLLQEVRAPTPRG